MAYIALILPVIVGSAALSVDVAFWHMKGKAVQSAADAAVIAATGELIRSNPGQAGLEAAARDATARNGIVHDGVDTIVEVFNPPPAGAVDAGNNASVHVRITQPAQGIFSGMFDVEGADPDGAVSIRNHATARGALNRVCIWVLSPTKEAALHVSGGAIVNLTCGAFSNSNHNNSLVQEGSSELHTPEARSVGVSPGIVDGGGIFAPLRETGATPVTDPKLSQAYPTFAWSCLPGFGYAAPFIVNPGTTFNLVPGADDKALICRDIIVKGGGTLNMAPGIYIFDLAGLAIAGSGIVNAADVHIFFTDFGFASPFNDDTDYHDILQVSGGSTLNLRASNTGEIKGFAIFHHRNPFDTTMVYALKGGLSMQIAGIIYVPKLRVEFAGGANLNATSSLLIVDSVTFTGNTEIGSFDTSGIAAQNLLVQLELID